MAVLAPDQRRDFALPGGRFPIPDASHARAALSGASRAENVGNITPAQKATVDTKADAKLGHPRQHSLTMASASHLHKAGYLSTAHHDAIRKDAAKRLSVHKKPASAPVYGSMAPQSAGHYLSTVNPAAAQQDDQGWG